MPKKILITSALLTLLLTAHFFIPTSGANPPDDPAPRDSNPIHALSFNIRHGKAPDAENHWKHRKELVFEVLRTPNDTGEPWDIIGLQEALDFQLVEIDIVRPAYLQVGVGRDDGKSAGEHCPILYRRDRFEALESDTLWLSPTPKTPGSAHPDAALPRIATWARLKDRSTNTTILAINTHWDHASPKARADAAAQLADFITQNANNNPVILLGDLNTDLATPPATDLNLTSSYHANHPNKPAPGTYHAFKGTPTGPMIDGVLINDRFTTLDANIDTRAWQGKYPSDHFPVWATLAITPAPQRAPAPNDPAPKDPTSDQPTSDEPEA